MKDYYPVLHHGCQPIHAVHDWAYVRRLIRAARRGEKIDPIVISGEVGNGQMLNGTHRSAANDLIVMLGGEALIDVISVDEMEVSDALADAIDSLDYDLIDALLDRA
jgi:hypothetical protein